MLKSSKDIKIGIELALIKLRQVSDLKNMTMKERIGFMTLSGAKTVEKMKKKALKTKDLDYRKLNQIPFEEFVAVAKALLDTSKSGPGSELYWKEVYRVNLETPMFIVAWLVPSWLLFACLEDELEKEIKV